MEIENISANVSDGTQRNFQILFFFQSLFNDFIVHDFFVSTCSINNIRHITYDLRSHLFALIDALVVAHFKIDQSVFIVM